jgi:hypothetical protein
MKSPDSFPVGHAKIVIQLKDFAVATYSVSPVAMSGKSASFLIGPGRRIGLAVSAESYRG